MLGSGGVDEVTSGSWGEDFYGTVRGVGAGRLGQSKGEAYRGTLADVRKGEPARAETGLALGG